MDSSPLSVLLCAALASAAFGETSDLWGTNGERWNSYSRLPDFSYAGYHCGESSPPEPASGVSIKTFGAKGDGRTDDTAAFLKALETVKGAIEIPAGRYVITNILEIKRSGVVLRGEGPDKTFLRFPKPLHEIKPVWSATTKGEKTSAYSWAGGFVWFKGDYGSNKLAAIETEARRGDNVLHVSDAKNLRVGQRIEVFEADNKDNSLAASLYSGDPGKMEKLLGSTHASLVCRVVRINGSEIEIDRPLRFDVNSVWKPCIRSFEPAVTEAAVENLCFEFPVTPYGGHFKEMGYNAVAMSEVSDCWVRNLRIVNADSGIFSSGRFCTVQNVTFESHRKPDGTGNTGHHGFDFEGEDNLFTGFDFRTKFIHDITVDHCASGNVSAAGKGVDLCFDHHRRACYENLFVDIDAGKGTRLWASSGGDDLGKHCAARGTFWNIRTDAPQDYPPEDFAPVSINLVALHTRKPAGKEKTGKWFETTPPGKIVPPDIHIAQLTRRLNAGKQTGTTAPESN